MNKEDLQALKDLGIDLRVVGVGDLLPNSYNPNQMEKEVFDALASDIKKHGMVQTILVRESLDKKGKYEIVDGEHRYKGAVLAGLKKVAVVVVNLDDAEAKLHTLSMNHLRGHNIPIRLAQLLVDLQKTYTNAEIAALTGLKEDDQYVALALLKTPNIDFSNKEEKVEKPSKKTGRPEEVSILMLPNDHEEFIEAMNKAVAYAGTHITPLVGDDVAEYQKAMKDAHSMTGMKLRSIALAAICKVFNELPNEHKKMAISNVIDSVRKKASS